MGVENIVMGVDMNAGDIKKDRPASFDIAKAVSKFMRDYNDINFVLFGRRDELAGYLKQLRLGSRAKLEDSPSTMTGVREIDGGKKSSYSKKDSSLYKLLGSLKTGIVDCAFSMGETGALVLYSNTMLGLIKGVEAKISPLVAVLPSLGGKSFLFGDVGANPDASTSDLLTYAILCDTYAREVSGIGNPRIGLLSIGTEVSKEGRLLKGNESAKVLHKMLSERKDLNYIGPVEGKHGIFTGIADIVIADGFTGNVALKMSEGTAELIEEEFNYRMSTKNVFRILYTRLGIMLLSGTLIKVKKDLSPNSYNGAPLLGLNYYVVKGHGNSTVEGVYHGLKITRQYYKSGAIEKIRQRFLKK